MTEIQKMMTHSAKQIRQQNRIWKPVRMNFFHFKVKKQNRVAKAKRIQLNNGKFMQR